MVEFLIEMGANINALTNVENQTPLHYAAQNDATSSLKVLLNLNANIDALDYKERTPLQVNSFITMISANIKIEYSFSVYIFNINKVTVNRVKNNSSLFYLSLFIRKLYVPK